MLDTYARKLVQPLFERLATICIRLHLSPNTITLISLLVGVFAGLFIYLNMPLAALACLWCSGLLDVLDGTVARRTGKVSAFGTVMDITFDRIVELSLVIGIACRNPDITFYLLILTASIVISMTIFLTVAAAADKSGIKSFFYQAGIAERSEGFIMFSLMIIFSQWAGLITLIFAGMIFFTALQRFFEAKRLFEK
ncbi:MAG: CDP-alcohol phosphatidyltransferase family protein [Spirochaetia bacterium]|nr:CDP-alcohol phosphatidyltransferase family protein [Spirochaetia bacterium]